MATDEIRLPALEAAIEGYEDAVAMLPSKYGNAAREELCLVLEVVRAAEAWDDLVWSQGNGPSESEVDAAQDRIHAALSALRSVR